MLGMLDKTYPSHCSIVVKPVAVGALGAGLNQALALIKTQSVCAYFCLSGQFTDGEHALTPRKNFSLNLVVQAKVNPVYLARAHFNSFVAATKTKVRFQ